MKNNGKRILSVKIKRTYDESPDTSYLGEYSNKIESDYTIDRALDMFTGDVDLAENWFDRLESVLEAMNVEDDDSTGVDAALETVRELRDEFVVSWVRREYRYFNGVVDNYRGLPEDDVRKYVRQDYERMKRLNAGDWCYLTIVATAAVTCGAVVQELTSGGLSGVESDGGDYLESVERDELAGLKGQLAAYGFSSRAIAAAFKTAEHVSE